MTIFEFEVGDRAAVEALRDIQSGEVVGRQLRVENHRPVPHVTVQVAENVTVTCPQSEAESP